MRHRRSVQKPLHAETHSYYFKCYCSRCKLRYETFSKNFFLFYHGNYVPSCMPKLNSHHDLLNPLGEIAVAQTGTNGWRKSRSSNKVTPSVQLKTWLVLKGDGGKIHSEPALRATLKAIFYICTQSLPAIMRWFIFWNS